MTKIVRRRKEVMKFILSLLLSVWSVEAAASYMGGIEVSRPCSKKELLRNRSDIPKITPHLSCHKIRSKKIGKIESLSKSKAGFDYAKANTGDFCLAVLERHREHSEVFFSGSLSYKIGENRNKVRKDIEASAEFKPNVNKHFRGLPKISSGELRPDIDHTRIYQEKDLGQFTDIRIDRKTLVADVHIRDRAENLDVKLTLDCERM